MSPLTQLVRTLEAARLKWKLLTLRMESASKDSTYNSPSFSDKTSFSLVMNAI